ncbi:Monoacylglycerol lipase ABHD6 [Varanus komodoensis]|nr:Monoacylglycerol lipase ABHD6 [Varanus komodoensis]
MDFILLKIFLMHTSIFIGVLLILCASIYMLWPSVFLTIFRWYLCWRNGLKVRYAQHEGYKFCYFSRGKPGFDPSILMLHGFSLSKSMWLLTLEYLPKDTHLICVDLPGHGETTCLPGDDYTPVDQAKRLHQVSMFFRAAFSSWVPAACSNCGIPAMGIMGTGFVECTGLSRKPFHLVGLSMGGMVAGVYAALYPSDVCALSLLCPAGVRNPKDNKFITHLKELEESHKLVGNNPLIPLNVQQGVELYKLSVYHRCRISKQFLKAFLKQREQENKFYEKYWRLDVANLFLAWKGFSDFTTEKTRYSLHDHMSKITAPTQIIWGKNDQILDPSGAEILASGIPDTQVHMLEKCGHCIIFDCPKKTAELLLDFYNSNCAMKNKILA